jgi:hypothetical protein
MADGGAAIARVGQREVRGGRIEPHMRADIVRLAGLALGLEEPEIVLGLRIAKIGGAVKPLRGLGVVLRHASTQVKHDPRWDWAAASSGWAAWPNHLNASLYSCGKPRPP